jgi:serine protease Do
MRRIQIRFIGYCLTIALITALTVVMVACSSATTSPVNTSLKPAPSATSQPVVSTKQNLAVNIPSFADLINVARPSVVEIDVTSTVRSGRRTVLQQGAGSGWIMDVNGTIITNNHVITGATSITVTTSDGKTYPANLINADPLADLAIIKITATQLQNLKMGDASKLRTGDWVLALGNPLGEGIIATQGIVSRMGVSVPVSSTQTYNDLIETTAPINPGNSGGPLINMSGEVIGITTLGATGVQGMGYAISVADALPAIQKLLGK